MNEKTQKSVDELLSNQGWNDARWLELSKAVITAFTAEYAALENQLLNMEQHGWLHPINAKRLEDKLAEAEAALKKIALLEEVIEIDPDGKPGRRIFQDARQIARDALPPEPEEKK